MDEKFESHPSFGQITAGRVQSNPSQPMYGSKLRHGRYIIITISQSKMFRSINSDRYCDDKQLIQVRLTENQFAQFITSLNIGGGVPCTIERLNMKQVEPPPLRDEVAIVKNTFDEKTKVIARTLEAAQKRLATMVAPGGKASKAELNLLQKEIEHAAREISGNMPYMVECFVETMEDVVTSAKTDIEAYMSDAAARAGVKGLEAPVTLQLGPTPMGDDPDSISSYVCEICGNPECSGEHYGEGFQ